MATLDDVSAIALGLPEVVETDRRGDLVWSVKGGKAMAWERPYTKADLRRFGEETPPAEPILAVRVADLGEKESILSEGRPGFFTIPHFDGFAAVLIELAAVREDHLRQAIIDAWLACAPPRLAAEHAERLT